MAITIIQHCANLFQDFFFFSNFVVVRPVFGHFEGADSSCIVCCYFCNPRSSINTKKGWTSNPSVVSLSQDRSGKLVNLDVTSSPINRLFLI